MLGMLNPWPPLILSVFEREFLERTVKKLGHSLLIEACSVGMHEHMKPTPISMLVQKAASNMLYVFVELAK
jgi:hypothetical protein